MKKVRIYKKMNLNQFALKHYPEDFIDNWNQDFNDTFYVIYLPQKKEYLTNIYKNGSVRSYEQSICALRFHYSRQLFLYINYCKYRGYEVEVRQCKMEVA